MQKDTIVGVLDGKSALNISLTLILRPEKPMQTGIIPPYMSKEMSTSNFPVFCEPRPTNFTNNRAQHSFTIDVQYVQVWE